MTAEQLLVLVSWAVHLSGYAVPSMLPYVEYRPHGFFVERACGGRECDVHGWYNDDDIIYLDARYRDDDGLFAASLVVHEAVHYLQDVSGRFGPGCGEALRREREAYAAQNKYLAAHGHLPVLRPAPGACAYPTETDPDA